MENACAHANAPCHILAHIACHVVLWAEFSMSMHGTHWHVHCNALKLCKACCPLFANSPHEQPVSSSTSTCWGKWGKNSGLVTETRIYLWAMEGWCRLARFRGHDTALSSQAWALGFLRCHTCINRASHSRSPGLQPYAPRSAVRACHLGSGSERLSVSLCIMLIAAQSPINNKVCIANGMQGLSRSEIQLVQRCPFPPRRGCWPPFFCCLILCQACQTQKVSGVPSSSRFVVPFPDVFFAPRLPWTGLTPVAHPSRIIRDWQAARLHLRSILASS